MLRIAHLAALQKVTIAPNLYLDNFHFEVTRALIFDAFLQIESKAAPTSTPDYSRKVPTKPGISRQMRAR
jgi:hypothetical protein